MRGHTIRRAMLMVVGMTLFLGFSPEVAHASGGGGCGRAVTDKAGTRVNIRNYCFGPTILRVRPGDTVTWVNRDGFPHTVLGANGAWGGYDRLGRDKEISFRFVSSGVYPYVCTYHPGMIGVVVVGNGKPDGAAQAVTTNARACDQLGLDGVGDRAACGARAGTAEIVGAGDVGDRPPARGWRRDHSLPETSGSWNRNAVRFVPS